MTTLKDRIYAHTMLIKTPLFHQSFGPRVFLSFLSFRLISWSAEACWAHFLARASKTLSRRRTVPSPPSRGRLVPTCSSASSKQRALLALCVNQGISASFSLFYFLIVDSGPPGSSPFKDQQALTGKYSSTFWVVTGDETTHKESPPSYPSQGNEESSAASGN